MPPVELDLLVLTPDFLPPTGGIQRLLGGLLRNVEHLHGRVVTLGGRSSRQPPVDGFEVQPVWRFRNQHAAVTMLNLAGVVAGATRVPDVILSGHIVTSPAAALLRRILRRPVVQYFYATEITARPKLARFAAAQAEACIAISAHTCELAIASGIPSGSIQVIPPGLDGVSSPSGTSRFDRPTVITVSRLAERYKGHDVMLRALPLVRAKVPEVEWLVVGDGPLRAYLESLTRRLGLEGSVRFLGEVSDATRADLLNRAHVFSMPSRLERNGLGGEGFGLAYLEASQRGVPIVAGNVGGALDAVDDGVTGLLVDPTNHLAVADAVSALITDRELAERLGRSGIEHARAFAWPRIARRVEELLFEVAGHDRTGA
jgi:phosphatidyl-myo-inositol dimannoside synthase